MSIVSLIHDAGLLNTQMNQEDCRIKTINKLKNTPSKHVNIVTIKIFFEKNVSLSVRKKSYIINHLILLSL